MRDCIPSRVFNFNHEFGFLCKKEENYGVCENCFCVCFFLFVKLIALKKIM